MKRLFLILLATSCLCSCRSVVFEDRTECPKFLFLNVTNPERFSSYDKVYNAVFRYPNGGQIAADQPMLREIQDMSYYVEVRKTEAVKGYGLIGWGGLTQNVDDWVVPTGMQADTLYRYSYTVDMDDEMKIVPVEFYKEHCKVTVQFVGYETFSHAQGRFPFDIVVRSNSCGINAFTGLPVRGDFQYRPVETSTGRFEFTLLRQINSDLTMDLYGRKALVEDDGYYRTFDLYKMIAERSDITWNEKNLPDLYIEIDFVAATAYIQVDYWNENSLHFDL